MDDPTLSPPPAVTAAGPESLPDDELMRYAHKLGLALPSEFNRPELVQRVRARTDLLQRLERAALLDIVKWARVPVPSSISKEQLVAEIADIQKVDYETLSDAGLGALALLRELPVSSNDARDAIERRLHKAETIGNWFTRKRRAVAAKLLSRFIDMGEDEEKGEYKFLPDDAAQRGPTLREEIAGRGIVGSLTNRLRGAADDYVRTKMDEIEQRIDQKLDEIDKRLGEWRDREVANRLRIIRITIIASVLVAALSLAYKYVSRQVVPESKAPAGSVAQDRKDR